MFRLPKDDSIDYIKRVIGLPGDRIQMINGALYINERPVQREHIDFVESEGGGPTERAEKNEIGSRSFLFPQMQVEKAQQTQFACANWRPEFVDYLFIAFTTSSTFGPTDAPLLARWAKVFAMVQITISLAIVVLLISRAVGVL